MVSYDKQTINTPNPIARFAHRNRLARALNLVSSQNTPCRVLDYGCGSGSFVEALRRQEGFHAYGYEPFMSERAAPDLPIHDDFDAVAANAPYDVVTLFETIEHLSPDEISEFLRRVEAILAPNGKILISAPVEIGPALFLKEFNRCLLFRRRPEHGFIELLLASLIGIAAGRAADIKKSHKGFDFRKTIQSLQRDFGPVTIQSYGPLPIGTWYGNSQVYFWLSRHGT